MAIDDPLDFESVADCGAILGHPPSGSAYAMLGVEPCSLNNTQATTAKFDFSGLAGPTPS